jgi:hypothetical protein
LIIDPTPRHERDIFDHRPLLEMGMITEKDRENIFVPKGSGNSIYKWSFFRCSGAAGSRTGHDRSDICAGIASTADRTGESLVYGMPISTRTRLPNEFICNIEIMKDDENVTDGYGRMPSTSVDVAYYEDDEVYRNCSGVPWDHLRDDQFITYNDYTYRVF